LRPYRRAAERYLKAHREDFWINAALKALRSLMERAGPVERVSDVLHFLSPPERARAALARLRRAKIPPQRLLAIHLAVTAAVKEDPIGPRGPPDEYRLTQIAKAVHRLASGYHAVYGPGSRYDRYPRSAGLALRHLGRMLDECCEHVAREHLAAILALKAAVEPLLADTPAKILARGQVTDVRDAQPEQPDRSPLMFNHWLTSSHSAVDAVMEKTLAAYMQQIAPARQQRMRDRDRQNLETTIRTVIANFAYATAIVNRLPELDPLRH
jgi:hypothetical protein